MLLVVYNPNNDLFMDSTNYIIIYQQYTRERKLHKRTLVNFE